MAQGLIAAALSGFGKALSSVGEMEAKKQNEAKLRKELMDMESTERLRLDEITFGREMARAPIRAKTTAEANVIGENAGLDAAASTKLYAKRGAAKATEKVEQYKAEDAVDLTTVEAEREANREKAGYTAKTNVGLPDTAAAYEAKVAVAKIDALLDARSLNNLDYKEAMAEVNKANALIDARETLGLDVKEQRAKVKQTLDYLNERNRQGAAKAEAGDAADKRLEEIRAAIGKNVVTEEANLLAKQEQAKIQAMINQGVPEAEAKLLAAKWKAGKTQRDEAAAEKTQQEMTDAITKAGNKKFMNAERTQAVNKRVVSDSGTKEKEKVTTADLSRKLQVAEDELAEALGVSDKKKVNEEIRLLTEMANNKKNPDPEAKQKLKDIEQLRANVKRRRDELQNWRDKPEEDKSGNDKKSGNGKPSISSFNK